MREQLEYINKLKTDFADRFYEHLDKFISQHVRFSDFFNKENFSNELPGKDLSAILGKNVNRMIEALTISSNAPCS